MLVLSVLSNKGGVGKTTTVLGLAGAALERGLKTLVVDLDPQANATTGLGGDSGGMTVADVIEHRRKGVVLEAVSPSSWKADGGGRVDLIAGAPRANALDDPEPSPARLRRLGAGLAYVSEGYDLVLLDSPPTLRLLTRSGLHAADRALVVSEPALFSVQGAESALRAVHEERGHNPALQPLGVLVTRFRDRSPEHRFRLNEMRSVFGPLVLSPAVPERSAVQQAQGSATPVQQWATPGAREASAAYDAALARVLRVARSLGVSRSR